MSSSRDYAADVEAERLHEQMLKEVARCALGVASDNGFHQMMYDLRNMKDQMPLNRKQYELLNEIVRRWFVGKTSEMNEKGIDAQMRNLRARLAIKD